MAWINGKILITSEEYERLHRERKLQEMKFKKDISDENLNSKNIWVEWLSSSKSYQEQTIATQSAVLNRISKILDESDVITDYRLETLNKAEAWIGKTVTVLYDDEEKWEQVYKIGWAWAYILWEWNISYLSPLWQSLKWLKAWDDFQFQVEDWKIISGEILKVERTKK